MKNIHVIPTDKPSRICKDEFGSFYLTESMESKISFFKNQNIYITSDEEIEENYVLSHGVIIKVMMFDNETLYFINGTKAKREDCKKIILTTDQDLIEDGVQAIDDEFLEWFIKNPNCEYITVYDGLFGENRIWKKYIIIPKEEPKQDFYKIGNFHKLCDDSCKYHCTKGNTQIADCLKQETLKEAAESFFNKRAKEQGFDNWTQIIVEQEWEFIESFPIEFAKWQQERMYSEEEVFELLENLVETFNPPTDNLKEWFEQFKKK